MRQVLRQKELTEAEKTHAIESDTEVVAEMVVMSVEDVQTLGNTVASLIDEVTALKAEIETLKSGGNA